MAGYWLNETTGVLRDAVSAYLGGGEMTGEQVAAVRAYLRQWIMDPVWVGEGIDDLRVRIDGLTTRAALKAWFDLAMDWGIDPL